MTISNKTAIFAASTIAVIVIAATLLWRVEPTEPPAIDEMVPPIPDQAAVVDTPPPLETTTATPEEIDSLPEELKRRKVILFFQSPLGQELMPEAREIYMTDIISDQARQTVRQLIVGPQTDLLPTIPPGTEVREVYLAADGTAYVDFSMALIDGHPGGTSSEIDTVFSIVNTLAYNFSEIRRVKILVEGEERRTLKNHLDINRAFVPDMSIVVLEED